MRRPRWRQPRQTRCEGVGLCGFLSHALLHVEACLQCMPQRLHAQSLPVLAPSAKSIHACLPAFHSSAAVPTRDPLAPQTKLPQRLYAQLVRAHLEEAGHLHKQLERSAEGKQFRCGNAGGKMRCGVPARQLPAATLCLRLHLGEVGSGIISPQLFARPTRLLATCHATQRAQRAVGLREESL